jgi:hypothetical protein
MLRGLGGDGVFGDTNGDTEGAREKLKLVLRSTIW